jgi:hypothetical protein
VKAPSPAQPPLECPAAARASPYPFHARVRGGGLLTALLEIGPDQQLNRLPQDLGSYFPRKNVVGKP